MRVYNFPKTPQNTDMGVVDFTKSLWNNPYRWSLVKGIGMFALAIYIARELEAAEAEAVAETAAQLSQPR